MAFTRMFFLKELIAKSLYGRIYIKGHQTSVRLPWYGCTLQFKKKIEKKIEEKQERIGVIF